MDVVGGVIVAAQSGKGAGGGGGGVGRHVGAAVGEELVGAQGRGLIGVKRAASGLCGGEYGALAWDAPWSGHLHQRRVSPRREGATAVERDDYELRSVLTKSVTCSSNSRGGKLARSTSSSSGSLGYVDLDSWGFSPSESTRALLAPFYRPANPVFVKPLPARSWVDPLQFLLKKELTVTDVGELGRIILPKRDAENQLPHLDSKEGKLLNMEDYNSNKHWTLRYKWWPNNKSRMYVLECTGEFVKYYDLKEKDELIVYKDGVGNLVIRGQKWSPANSFLRTDTFLGITGFKGKSTGKRSPKGANARANARLSPNTSSISNPTQAAAVTTNFQTKLDSSPPQPSVAKLLHPLDCALLPGSVLASSVLATSVLNVEQSELGSIGTLVGPISSFAAVPGGHGDGVIDWEKLPDPPALEFSDPPTIEFPGEFECTWGDCI